MSRSILPCRPLTVALVAAISSFLLPLTDATAQDGPAAVDIIRIEEDWKLVVESPDTNSGSPQIRCVLSPNGDIESTHAAFTLNHHSQPDYQEGGMQLQLWSGESIKASQANSKQGVLSHEGETVTWTQSMSLDSGTLTFAVTNGSSTTWGSFGGEGYLKFTVATERTSLGNYLPSVSLNNSEVGFAANRVERLELVEVRAYTADGLYGTATGGTVTLNDD